MAETGSATANTVSSYPGGVQGRGWAETRYLSEFDWGTGGSNISGSMTATAGKRIDNTYAFTLSHTSLTAFVPKSVYYMSWYQPKYAVTYDRTALRRYNAG